MGDIKMHSVGVGASDVGRVREQNEDRLFFDNDLGLYMVCDGMGGCAAGEVAAEMTIEIVTRELRSASALVARVRRGDEPITALQTLMEQAVNNACAAVHEAATSDEGRSGMGTTLTAIVTAGDKAVMAHVGDSRLYLLRESVVHQITSDHTMVAELIVAGVMTPEQARTSPYAHALTRAIGIQPSCKVDTLVLDLLPRDSLLLCSDGLTEYVDGQNLVPHLTNDLESIPDALIEVANTAGGHDNISIIVVRVDIEDEDRGASATLLVDGGVQVQLDLLASTFLCQDLSLANLQRVVNLCTLRTFERGEAIFRDGVLADSLAIILDGRASVQQPSVEQGDTLPGTQAETLGSGDCAGAPFLLTPRPAAATLLASEPVTCLFLSREKFLGLASKRPWLGVELMGRVGIWCSSTLERATRNQLRPFESL